MRGLRFVFALLAAFATVIVPIAPASAAPASQSKAAAHKIVEHAKNGEALILNLKQLEQIRATNKNLHAKLMTAYRANSIPALTAEEKSQLQAMTRKNVAEMKAGGAENVAITAAYLSTLGVLVLGLIGLVLVLIAISGIRLPTAEGPRFARAMLFHMLILPVLFGAQPDIR